MKKKVAFWADLGWKEWAGLAAGVLVCLFVAAKLSPDFRAILFSSNTASWVQGVGVFVAIMVSVLSQQAAERRKRLDRIETIRIVVSDCKGAMSMFQLQCEDGEALARSMASGRPLEDLRLTAEMLTSLDVYDFPNNMALRFFLILRGQVGGLSGQLSQYADTLWHTTEGVAVLRKLAATAGNAERCANVVLECLVANGRPISDGGKFN